MKQAIMMDAKDNVANAISAIKAGEEVAILSTKQEVVQRLKAKSSLPLGHKIALMDIKRGDEIKKYGAVIGKASKNIAAGEYVHIHNVESNRMPLTEHMLGYK
ncbi:MAG: D-galactarate dehydratase [Chloroflexi bacterium]|nr:D-galactarate dehydratase [Chloroflexota bacterium]